MYTRACPQRTGIIGDVLEVEGLVFMILVDSTGGGRLQNRAQRAFGGHRVLPDEPLGGVHHAVEVLGPGPVYRAVNHHVPDLLRPQFLRAWREADEGVDLPFCEERHRLYRGMCDPVDVFGGVQADVRHHTGEEDVIRASQFGHGDGLLLQVADSAHTLSAEQLEAADMPPCQDHNWIPRVQMDEERPNEVQGDVNLTGD